MNIEEFKLLLHKLPKGKAAHLPYEIYALLFPPGEPSQDARAAAYEFAKAHGCVIDNRPKSGEVLFVKN